MSVTDHPGFQQALFGSTATECELIIAAVKAAEGFHAGCVQSRQVGYQVQQQAPLGQAPHPIEQGPSMNGPTAAEHLRTLLLLCESSSSGNLPVWMNLTHGETLASNAAGVDPVDRVGKPSTQGVAV